MFRLEYLGIVPLEGALVAEQDLRDLEVEAIVPATGVTEREAADLVEAPSTLVESFAAALTDNDPTTM